jgi:hypothetical protein
MVRKLRSIDAALWTFYCKWNAAINRFDLEFVFRPAGALDLDFHLQVTLRLLASRPKKKLQFFPVRLKRSGMLADREAEQGEKQARTALSVTAP